MVKIGTDQQFIEHILSVPRPGEGNILAFYAHHLGAVFTNPRLMLIPLDDHLVHRGDGVFEVLRYEHSAIYQLDEHLDRLQRSARAIDLALPVEKEELKKLLFEVCRVGQEDAGLVLIFCGRGPGGFTLDFRECPQSSLYIVAKRAFPKPESFWTNGVSAMRTSVPARPGWMSQIKSVNYLPNVLMKLEAIKYGADYPLCFDTKDCLVEGSTENVVVIDAKGKFVVPELKNALIGTTLARALEFARTQFDVITRSIHEDELYSCREIILLGTSIDAVAVVLYNNKRIGDGKPGPMAMLLRKYFIDNRSQNATNFFN